MDLSELSFLITILTSVTNALLLVVVQLLRLFHCMDHIYIVF